MTKLGDAIEKGAAAAPTKAGGASRLAAALAGRRPFRPIKVPVHGIEHAAVMTVIGSERQLDLEGETVKAMEGRGFTQAMQNELHQTKFELDLAIRVLAVVVRVSEQDPAPFGSLADWGQLVPEVIADLWQQYAELRAEHDPALGELAASELAGIEAAVKKKDPVSLAFFGARRLARYLLILEDRRESSSTSRSLPGDSSPASSPSDSASTQEADDDSGT